MKFKSLFPKYSSVSLYLSFVCLLIITIGSLAPITALPVILRGFLKSAYEGDCVLHFAAYAGLGFLSSQIGLSIKNKVQSETIAQWLVTFVSLAVFSGIIEILQPQFSPTRYASWSDFVANVSGLFVGMGVTILFMSSFLGYFKSDSNEENEKEDDLNSVQKIILENNKTPQDLKGNFIIPIGRKYSTIITKSENHSKKADPFNINHYANLVVCESDNGTLFLSDQKTDI